MLALIDTVRHKTGIEFHEVLIFTFLHLAQVDGFEHPHSPLLLKIITLHHTRFQENPLHLYRCQRSIAHHVHILFLIKKQGVIVLLGKQIIVLPEVRLYLQRSVTVIIGQRKYRPLPLQSIIRSIIEDKIIKQLVCLHRLRFFLHFCFQQRIGLVTGRIHHFRNGSKGIHFRLFVSTRNQKGEQQKSQ